MHYVIIGTAGHVDHGKTTLVKALTGQETDRLKEEKERGISIELGFASYQLDKGQKIGLVDVPGHERFIRQMLAGVAGMDLVLLIIAADEGVMPQTREHLDIISLLNVKRGIVVLTKADLVDQDWLELVQEDVKELLAITPLKEAPLISVSGKTGMGIAQLKELIAAEVAKLPVRPAQGRPRLPIDRVFSVAGFGTVVTGTLWSGKIMLGDRLVIYPKPLEAKVRNIQVHGEGVEEAAAGQRVAINLGNISLEQIDRGDVLAAPAMLTPSFRMDGELTMLAGSSQSLAHRQRVRIHLGTAEVLGRISLLDKEELEPGETALAQLVLEKEMVALGGDRFVIRSYSPMVTIGGGTVIEPEAKKAKRYRKDILEKMQVKLAGTPEEKLYELIRERAFCDWQRLAKELNYDSAQVKLNLNLLQETGKVAILHPGDYVVAEEKVLELAAKAKVLVEGSHREFPLRIGMPKEELRTRLGGEIGQKIFNALLEYWLTKDYFAKLGDKVAVPNYRPSPTPEQEQRLTKIIQALEKEPYQPPIKKELANILQISGEVMEELLQFLIGQGKIIKISEEIYLMADSLKQLQQIIAELYRDKGEIVLGEVRDITGSSRKYILPLLEYLDQIKFTRRTGEKRVLY
jgi:selenocysteine-specific elongation factor